MSGFAVEFGTGLKVMRVKLDILQSNWKYAKTLAHHTVVVCLVLRACIDTPFIAVKKQHL